MEHLLNLAISSVHFTIESCRGTCISITLILFGVVQLFSIMSRFAETVLSVGTVACTPQSREHVSVVSYTGASLLLSTIFTPSFFFWWFIWLIPFF